MVLQVLIDFAKNYYGYIQYYTDLLNQALTPLIKMHKSKLCILAI